MTASEVRDIIVSADYMLDLRELSCYLASIKQERPIIYCLAKQLWKRGVKFQLEAKRTDLVINGKKFEFKFHYDFDMTVLSKELQVAADKLLSEVCAQKPTHGWVALPRLYADMVTKGANVFVLVILSRDLSGLEEEAQERICLPGEQRKWNEKHPYGDRSYLEIADRFLNRVQVEKRFTVTKEEVQTTGLFPSTYHFWFCEFTSH
jgi:hypothetical protein